MLRAFTIMELLMVSLLTVITVGAAFTAFELINMQFTDYEKGTSQQLDVQRLHSLLLEDVYKADEVQFQGDQIICVNPDYNLAYYTDDKHLIRAIEIEGVRADTFPVQITEWGAWENGEARSFGRVDLIHLSITSNETPFTFILTKEYSIIDQIYFTE